MKSLSIRQYVAWLTLTPLLVMAVSMESFFLHENFSDLDQNLMERGQLITRQLASSSEYGVFANNRSFLKNIAQGVLQQPDVRGVLILNAASEVLIAEGAFFGAPENTAADVSATMSGMDQTQTARAGKIKESVNLQLPVYRSSEGLRLYQPIVPAQVALDEFESRAKVSQIGAVIVEMSSAHSEQLKSKVLWMTVGLTALFLIFPFGLIYLGSRNITLSIRKLSDTIRALGDGRLETRVTVSATVTELETLAHGINDMTAKLQQEQTMLQQRTDTLIEAQRIAHLGDWEWDVVNNTVVWSDETYRIFGLKPQQIAATFETYIQAVHPDDRQYVENNIRESLELARPYSMDHRILLPDRTVRYVHERIEAVRNDEGQLVKLLGTTQDVTEAKLVDEKIRQMNEELETKVQQRTKQLQDTQEELVRREKLAVLGQVAGSVGHELRNPLGVMNNAVYFLQTVLSDADDTTREYLNIIKDEINASERIVSDLLDSVRTKPPHPERVGVRELIEKTLSKYSVLSSVTVKLDIPATLAPLCVDAMQIHQVLRNLISNGVEAMPEGGTLAISAVENKQDGTVSINVKDSGTGMTTEQLGHLFQPLFTTKARGIGLGLVVVKNLTQANGGKIEVQSEVGKGTTFTVVFPV